jgi:membrane peptidoglycan carboxypeptidase
VLAQLRAGVFAGKPAGFIENGGYSIVTTIDVRAQRLLEQVADETVAGSLLAGQPDNLQAAAVVVQPGSGRVLAYYGGHDGTGADYAGWYLDGSGAAVGYGAHPPGQTFDVYTLAAAVASGVSVESTWQAPASRSFPGIGRPSAVREVTSVACQPACTLAEAATASLNIPFVSVTQRIGAARVIDVARSVGISSMWVPATATAQAQRVDLRDTPSSALTPQPFTSEVALGKYPVTVLDQALGMATFAAGGVGAPAQFVAKVTKAGATVYEPDPEATAALVLQPAVVADVTWVLSHNPAGRLPGRDSATKVGVWQLRDSAVETAHAWIVGYTPDLAMAVWVGNEEIEFPLKDLHGARVTGTGLPASIYRSFMGPAHEVLRLPKVGFPAPARIGDPAAGDAPAPAAGGSP